MASTIQPTSVRARTTLRITATYLRELETALFPDDGKESVALLLCGRGGNDGHELFTVHRVCPLPADAYVSRTPSQACWRTQFSIPLLEEAARSGLAVCKVHSHRTEYARFSPQDDTSDTEWFRSLRGWFEDDRPHLSAVLLPSGRLLARTSWPDGRRSSISRISVIGDELLVRDEPQSTVSSANTVDETFRRRTRQALGDATTELLSRLTIAVIGASGTGSIVGEQCVRLGVGAAILVDPKLLEHRNVSRVLNSTCDAAARRRAKVDLLADAYRRTGLETKVIPLTDSIDHEDVVRTLSAVDVLFGCTDSQIARNLLNRIGTHYLIPYIDCGVRLDADAAGGIRQVSAGVHFCAPDGSWLIDRGVISAKGMSDEDLARRDPAAFAEQRARGYVRDGTTDRPAVITFNMLAAALAMNELLARLHEVREEGNALYRSVRLSLSQMRLITDAEAQPPSDSRKSMIGRGDRRPLLGIAGLRSSARNLDNVA